ncbi:MAG: IscS subfamily cysteine desulfurase [Holosporales bacterium]|jgi:cysteine desulfurase|nr:IscS subfamily cysteine desulfurase [Holosporales bacterium]
MSVNIVHLKNLTQANEEKGDSKENVSGAEAASQRNRPVANLIDRKNESIYLDSPATTQCDKRVFDKMAPYFCDFYGNAHSKNHVYGWLSEEAVDVARKQIADLLGAEEKEIVFTSGATEANVIAIRGVVDLHRYSKKRSKIHVITSAIEHKSILNCCKQLEEEGVRVTYLPVNHDGLIQLDDLKSAISEDTVLVSIMAVNNELGVIQPIEEIGAVCEERGVAFHSDITQAVGKMPLNLRSFPIALASLSSHKIYGPKGIGALFVRKKPHVKLRSIFPGGGQERGIRGGTLAVQLCVGFGEACRLLSCEFTQDFARIAKLEKLLIDKILGNIPLAKLNGSREHKVPHISNFAFPFVEGESIIIGLKNVCVSTGSACTSSSLEPSHVLQAINADEYSIHSSIRIGLGRFTTQEEVEFAIDKLVVAVEKLREISPLWEMYQDGVDFSAVNWAQT